MTLLLIYLFIAIVVSFFCSISEAVLLSVRPSYVAAHEREGGKGAKHLKKLLDNLNRPLAAILTANTIAHTVGAAGVGAQASIVFGSEYLGVVSGVLTFLVLVFSEIIPKTIGSIYWKQLAPSFGFLIDGLTTFLSPLVWMSEQLTRFLTRGSGHSFTFSRNEMEAMAEIGAKEGVLQAKELEIVSNLMRLHHLSVRDIMTPRPVIFSVSAHMTVQDFFSGQSREPFSRIPVFGDDVNDVVGYVLKFDLLIAQAKGEFDRPLSDFKRDLQIVLDVLSASAIFDRLMHEKSHIALVVDEYGTTQGLITLEDVLETLIGLEITDELDKVEDMQALAHDRWRKRMAVTDADPEGGHGKS